MTSAHLQLRMSWPLFLLVENLSLQVLFHIRMPLLLLTCFHHPATHNLHIHQRRPMLHPLNFDNRVSLLPSQLCTQMEVSPELHTHKPLTRPGTNRYHSNSCSHLLQFMVRFFVILHAFCFISTTTKKNLHAFCFTLKFYRNVYSVRYRSNLSSLLFSITPKDRATIRYVSEELNSDMLKYSVCLKLVCLMYKTKFLYRSYVLPEFYNLLLIEFLNYYSHSACLISD